MDAKAFPRAVDRQTWAVLVKVVVTGATGNVGTSVLGVLQRDPCVTEIVGLVRRPPPGDTSGVRWVRADVGVDDLAPAMDGAAAVIHLAWQIQPSRRPALLQRTNVHGSRRVFEAAVQMKVPAIIHASSVGTYARRIGAAPVDERWPARGIPTSLYSMQKAAVESMLDDLAAQTSARIVRLRPALTFKREAASGIRRLFLGPILPVAWYARHPRAVPHVPGLLLQVVHSDDVAAAYGAALHSDLNGAFNITADGAVGTADIARLLDARRVPLSHHAMKLLATAAYAARLQPAPPGWIDLAADAPVMSAERARTELGWTPTHPADETVCELVAGLAARAGHPTAPLAQTS